MKLYLSCYIFSCILHIEVTYSLALQLFRAGCSISVNKDLSDPQPLLLLQNGATTDIDAFILPHDKSGTISFKTGQIIDVACPGGSIIIDEYNTGKRIASLECLSGKDFWIEQKTISFELITCSVMPYHTARYTKQKCSEKYDEIEIGFDVEKRFIHHMAVCFDKNLQHTFYSKATLTSAIKGLQKNYPRPQFVQGSFYNVKPSNVNTLYTRNEQRRTINKILGLSPSDTSVISEKDDFYLSRGHYTAKADYVFGAQQRLTFYYVNVTPQWQVSNNGNWATMEADCRNLANKKKLDLIIYSGSFGVTTLPDVKGHHQELYLWNQENKIGIPVPKFMHRVVYEPKSKAGIAILSVNNPYNAITEKDIICRDVCDKVKWLTWSRFNLTLGYSYCCEVDEFRKTAVFLPKFDVKQLLI